MELAQETDRSSLLDLERQMLRKGFLGYDPQQVDSLLRKLAREIEDLESGVEVLQKRCDEQETELKELRTREANIKEVLMMAQQAAEDAKGAAQKEADLMVEAARQRILEVQKNSEKELMDLRWDIEALKLEKQKFIRSFKHLLEGHLGELNQVEHATVQAVVEVPVDEKKSTTTETEAVETSSVEES